MRRRPRERCMYLAGLVSLGLREIAVITLVEGCVCCAYTGLLRPSEPRPYRLTGKHRHKHAQDGRPDTLLYPPSSNPDRPTPYPRTAARRRWERHRDGRRTTAPASVRAMMPPSSMSRVACPRVSTQARRTRRRGAKQVTGCAPASGWAIRDSRVSEIRNSRRYGNGLAESPKESSASA